MAADPHIHVDSRLGADAVSRGIVASAFGLAADLPAVVRTGCGREVVRAMTSVRPESVTCLACREFARAGFLKLAADVEVLGLGPWSAVPAERARAAAAEYRERARRFG